MMFRSAPRTRWFALAALVGIFPAEARAQGSLTPIADYEFNSLFDGGLEDTAGYGNFVTLIGDAGLGPGHVGEGLWLGGTPVLSYGHASYRPDASLYLPSVGVTEEVWALPTRTTGNASARYDLLRISGAYGLFLYGSGPVQVRFFTNFTDMGTLSNPPCPNCPSSFVPDGGWHHFVGLYDATRHRHATYVDGILSCECLTAGDGGALVYNPGDFFIGMDDYSATQFWGGIDQGRFYAVALDEPTICAHAGKFWSDGGCTEWGSSVPPGPPGPPVASPNPSDGGIVLAWAPSPPVRPGLEGYVVSRDGGAPASWWTATNGSSDSPPEGLYLYGIEARDNLNNVSAPTWSAPVLIDRTPPTPPGAPTLRAVSGCGPLSIDWTPSTDDGGSGLAGYLLEAAGDGGWVEVSRPAAPPVTVTGPGIVRARAFDGVLNVSPPSPSLTLPSSSASATLASVDAGSATGLTVPLVAVVSVSGGQPMDGLTLQLSGDLTLNGGANDGGLSLPVLPPGLNPIAFTATASDFRPAQATLSLVDACGRVLGTGAVSADISPPMANLGCSGAPAEPWPALLLALLALAWRHFSAATRLPSQSGGGGCSSN